MLCVDYHVWTSEVSSLFCDTQCMTDALAVTVSTKVSLQLGVVGSPSQKGVHIRSNNRGLVSCLEIMYKQGRALLKKHGQLTPVVQLATTDSRWVMALGTSGTSDTPT